MSDGTISLKIRPLIDHDDDGKCLSMQLTVCGYTTAWIDTELKKCENHTFDYDYEFELHPGNKDSLQNSCQMPSIDPEVRKELESLNFAEKMIVKRVANELCESIVKHKDCQDEQQEPQTDKSAPAETVKTVEPSEVYKTPRLQKYLRQNDPVSAVAVYNEWILTGCHNGTLHIWTLKGKHRLGLRGHKAKVSGVAWISLKKDIANFVSVSGDGTAVMWVCNVAKNSVITRTVCTHERKELHGKLDAVSLNNDKTYMAAGGWGTTIKFWPTSILDKKKFGKYTARKTRETEKTIEVHKDVVTGLVWSDNAEIMSCSLDKTIKVLDFELGRVKQEFTNRESFYKLDYSPLCRSVIASTRNKVRLYDLRATGGRNLRTLFKSHEKPVRCLSWSTVDQNLFIIGGGPVQLWDIRNCKEPLFDLRYHEKEVLCCDWSNPKLMVFGGEDKIVRIFKSLRASA